MKHIAMKCHWDLPKCFNKEKKIVEANVVRS